MNAVMATLALLLLALAGGARAAAPDIGAVAAQVRELAQHNAAPAARATRIEVEVGRLDPRLKLAPCDRIEPHLPAGTRLWGASRIGLRCAAGPSKWNVFLPVTVKVFGTALVAARAFEAGATLSAGDFIEAEVDLAAEPGAAIVDGSRLAGRVLARNVAAGTALRESHMRALEWFAAGEAVRIVASGAGWQVAGEGVALAPGIDGRNVRIRTESGRIVSGLAVGRHRVQVPQQN